MGICLKSSNERFSCHFHVIYSRRGAHDVGMLNPVCNVVPFMGTAAIPVDAVSIIDGWYVRWFGNLRNLLAYSDIVLIIKDLPTPPPPVMKI